MVGGDERESRPTLNLGLDDVGEEPRGKKRIEAETSSLAVDAIVRPVNGSSLFLDGANCWYTDGAVRWEGPKICTVLKGQAAADARLRRRATIDHADSRASVGDGGTTRPKTRGINHKWEWPR